MKASSQKYSDSKQWASTITHSKVYPHSKVNEISISEFITLALKEDRAGKFSFIEQKELRVIFDYFCWFINNCDLQHNQNVILRGVRGFTCMPLSIGSKSIENLQKVLQKMVHRNLLQRICNFLLVFCLCCSGTSDFAYFLQKMQSALNDENTRKDAENCMALFLLLRQLVKPEGMIGRLLDEKLSELLLPQKEIRHVSKWFHIAADKACEKITIGTARESVATALWLTPYAIFITIAVMCVYFFLHQLLKHN